MVAQVAKPGGDRGGLAQVDQQEDTDLLARPVVAAEDQADEHASAQEPVDLAHEVEHERRDEAPGNSDDELLVHQLHKGQPSDGEERQADPDHDDDDPDQTPR